MTMPTKPRSLSCVMCCCQMPKPAVPSMLSGSTQMAA